MTRLAGIDIDAPPEIVVPIFLAANTGMRRGEVLGLTWRNVDLDNARLVVSQQMLSVQYEAAVADMIDRTSTEIAPWTIVEAEDKYFARVKILRTLVRTLAESL